MSKIFFTSDPHFLHTFVAGTRGYETAEEHDGLLIEAVNKTVTKRDTLWILGDLSMSSLTNTLEMVDKLNGTKRLVFGNHDAGHPMHKGSFNKHRRYLEVFDSVHVAESVKIQNQSFNLSHFPMVGDHYDGDRFTGWRLREGPTPLLCGHVHHQWKLSTDNDMWQMNVGVDHQFEPYSADEIYETWKATNGKD